MPTAGKHKLMSGRTDCLLHASFEVAEIRKGIRKHTGCIVTAAFLKGFIVSVFGRSAILNAEMRKKILYLMFFYVYGALSVLVANRGLFLFQ
jgi:hypothetical protein